MEQVHMLGKLALSARLEKRQRLEWSIEDLRALHTDGQTQWGFINLLSDLNEESKWPRPFSASWYLMCKNHSVADSEFNTCSSEWKQ